MNTALWVLQAVLALKFITTAISHASGTKDVMRESREKMGRLAPAAHMLSAAVMLVGALGVVAPAILRAWGWLAPAGAGLLAVGMLAAIPLHHTSREKPLLAADAILLVLCALALYGRLVLSPL